ncbi:hypothetical protein Tsubulata_044050, partial [Turnera subulata]
MAATTSLTTPKLQELLSTITIRDNLVNDILTWVLSGHSVIPSPNRACFKIFHGFFFQVHIAHEGFCHQIIHFRKLVKATSQIT